MEPKFDIEVSLSESNGNSFAIIAQVRRSLRKAGASIKQVEDFTTEAMNGDYDHVLQTCMKWVNVI